ncbi:MAG TPA: DUF6510 family protein [Thermoanaerobaculia bacterium]|jgi:hypothetical protein
MADTESTFVLDGNAAAGLLREIFCRDVTTAQTECAACGSRQIIGAVPVYAISMGAVLRCPRCDAVLIRAARTSHAHWLEMTGVRYLRF